MMPKINGTNGNDTINGTSADDEINGKSGDDTLFGLAGDDDIDGGSGDDSIDGGDGNDTIFGRSGDDEIDGGNDDDLIVGSSGNDTLSGGDGNDTLDGGSHDDVIAGGDGDDSIDAGAGDDTITGGEGNDTIDGGDDNDTVVYGGSIADFTLAASGAGIIVSDQNTGDGDEGSDLLTAVETVQFNDYTLDLTGGNNAPVALVADQTTDEDNALGFVLTLVDFDGDAVNAPVVTITSDNSSGAAGSILVLGAGTPTPGYAGLGQATDFNLQFDPGAGYQYLAATESVTETVTVTSTDASGATFTQSFDIVITGVNDLPVANDDSGAGFSTDEDTAVVTANVLLNDTDEDASDVLMVSAFDAVSAGGGTVAYNGDGTFTYDPNDQFEYLGATDSTTDTFSYTVSDGNGGTDTATVTIAISGVNDAPTGVDDSGTGFETDEDTAFVTGSVLANDTDVDNGAVLSVDAFDTTGTVGLVTNNGDGTFSYDPNGAFDSLGATESATDTFSYTVMDEFGETDTATVTISIAGVNDAPTAVDDSATTLRDTSVDINVLGNDSDPDGNDTISISDLIDPEFGSITQTGGVITYTPDAEFEGVDGFSYTITDGNGGFSTANVTINVGQPVTGNTAPVALRGTIAATADEGDTNILTVNFNTLTVNGAPIISDAEQSIAQLDITSFELPNAGRGGPQFTETSPGSNIFTLDLDELGVADGTTLELAVAYTVDDGQPTNSTASNEIILQITNPNGTPGNTAPVAAGATITQAEDAGDIEITLLGVTGLATDADDDPLTVTSISFTDEFGDPLSFDPLERGNTALVGGVVTINPVVFGLADTETGTFLMQYTVSDGEDSASGTVTLNLTGTDVNTAPTAEVGNEVRNDPDDVTLSTRVFEIDLNTLVSDVDQDPITIALVLVEDSSGAPVTANILDGVVTIVPSDLGVAPGATDTFVITYTASDGIADPVESTVNLTVNGPPVFTGEVIVDFEDISLEGGSSIPIDNIGGLNFDGTATVIEVDEIVGIGRPVLPGLIAGETTIDSPGEGTAAIIQGEFLEFDGTAPPTYGFTLYAPGSTAELGSGPQFVARPLNDVFGESFDLENLSLTALDAGPVTVSIIPYRVVQISTFEYDYVAVGSFDVTLSSTSATELDFNVGAFFDDDTTGDATFIFDDPLTTEVETSAFENIAAVQIVTTGTIEGGDREGAGLETPVNDVFLVVDDFVFDF